MILDECSIELFDIPDDLEIEVEMLLERWIKIVGLADTKYLLDKLMLIRLPHTNAETYYR